MGKGDGPTADLLVASRDEMLVELGPKWKQALAAATGSWMFDYFTLVAALLAVHAHVRPSLILLAYGATAVLGMIPITPGGLGFVEAGLTALLHVAGVPLNRAVLAVLAYRLVSFWLPILAGVVVYGVSRARHGDPPGGGRPR